MCQCGWVHVRFKSVQMARQTEQAADMSAAFWVDVHVHMHAPQPYVYMLHGAYSADCIAYLICRPVHYPSEWAVKNCCWPMVWWVYQTYGI